MKTTNKSTVEYINHMGDDLSIVKAARVSFDKESQWEQTSVYKGSLSFCEGKRLSEKDTKLINYLAKHNHWSPFAHTSIQLRISAPIFVSRQLVKHQVGGVWNEVSRRYVDEEPSFYFPDKWRKRAENVKQGSSDEEVSIIEEITHGDEYDPAYDVCFYAVDNYNKLLLKGVAAEQARMILPQNMMTTWIWTGSLMFFARVCKQRLDPHAQKETQEVAEQINKICAKLFPVSWKALMNDN